MKHKTLAIVMAVIMVLTLITPVLANPPYPEGNEPPAVPVDRRPLDRRPFNMSKLIDQPNLKDYLRNQERQRLLEAGDTALAASQVLSGTDRVLVILVEFAGTDVFTWTAPITPTDPSTGSQWDPLGIADPNEDTGVVGDCSNIITQTTVFNYQGPLRNMMARPISTTDRSGNSIWTDDFTKQWFTDFMFGNGVEISFTMQSNESMYASFLGQSVTDFYTDMSGGVYTVTGDVVGWVGVPHSTWYYDADQCPGARSGGGSRGAIPGAGTARQLVRDALDQVNAISDTILGGTFDWANYDKDGDGVIDRLWIVHAGYGEEDSTTMLNRDPVTGTNRTTPAPAFFYGEAAVWSHSSSVSPPYSVTQDIAAGPYIIMPENGGMGVFAHEYGHNLGADDLYAYGQGNPSAGFWTTMADDWTGHPIGFEPPAMDPWHLDYDWGWLNPMVITDTDQVYTFTLGQASDFPGGAGVYRGAKIELEDGLLPLAVPVWQGSNYWWGGKKDLANAMMTTVDPIDLTGGTAYTLSFDLVYDIEDEWDFLWIQVSNNSGTTWDTITNTNTQCVHDPSWIGESNGFPADLCGAGLGGFYGYNANWPAPEAQVFDLSSYAGDSILLRFWFMTDWGTTYTGAFIDNVAVTGATTLFSDDAESGDAEWTYADPWQRSNGEMAYTHNFYLQWRNVNDNGGYDSALGEEAWRFGPANTGLLVWYNNNFYTDNEIWSYFLDDPSVGPKGRMLVVDSQPEPYRDPDLLAFGFNNTGGNLTSRGQMRDAPFTLADTVAFTHIDPYRSDAAEHSYPGRPAVSEFRDAQGYYPGAEWVNRGPAYPPTQYKWVTKQWDASVVIPSTVISYPLKAVGYDGTVTNDAAEFRFNCSPYLSGPYAGYLGCYWFGNDTGLGYEGGTGNPGEVDGQYGWVVELLSEATDHTTATVRVSNDTSAFQYQLVTFDSTGTAAVNVNGPETYTVTYQTLVQNSGNDAANNVYVTYTLDADLTAVSMQAAGILKGTAMMPAGTVVLPGTYWWTDEMWADDIVTVTLVATGTVSPPLADDTLSTRVDGHDGQAAQGPRFVETDIVAPTVSFVTPTDGQSIMSMATITVPVEITTTNFVIPTDGHWHLWVDGTEIGTVLGYTTTASLTMGTHVISAELRLPDHTVLGPVGLVNVTVEAYTIFLPLVMRNF